VRLGRFLQNRQVLVVFIVMTLSIGAALFVRGAIGFRAYGYWMMLAHGCGAALNFAGALVIIPVMRRLLSWLRGTVIARWLPLDDAITLHRAVGFGIVFLGVAHTFGHLMYRHSVGGVFPWLTHYKFALSGLSVLAITLLMASFALPFVRKHSRFEWFYFTHSSYLLWFALMLAHGRHFYAWAALPVLAYAIERALRWRRHSQEVEIVDLAGLSSGVSRVAIRCPPDFRHLAGDYAFLRIPALARYEWHPFTISSAPGRPNITFHIRSEGDWTKALRRLVDLRRGNVTQPPLIAYLDGPFGSSNTQIFKSRYPVLIGAGIGVTPYASVLESLVTRANEEVTDLKKLYFFWLNRESRCFEWFADLLLKLERIDRNQRVEFRIFMTGARGHISAAALNLARDLSHRLGRPDWATGLRTQTGIGAPEFGAELSEIAARHAPDAVDVYFCGPPGLGRKVKKICAAQSIPFRQESF